MSHTFAAASRNAGFSSLPTRLSGRMAGTARRSTLCRYASVPKLASTCLWVGMFLSSDTQSVSRPLIATWLASTRSILDAERPSGPSGAPGVAGRVRSCTLSISRDLCTVEPSARRQVRTQHCTGRRVRRTVKITSDNHRHVYPSPRPRLFSEEPGIIGPGLAKPWWCHGWGWRGRKGRNEVAKKSNTDT